MAIRVITGDCSVALGDLADASIDACVTDPPYGLSFMGKAWDYDVPSADIWREVYRVLKPGAHLLAFFGSRTYHRGVVQIEDAGFEIRDQIMWVYGSGFPKSHDVAKSIDRSAGVAREDKFEGSFERRAGPTGNRRCDVCGKWLVSGSPCQCPRPQDAAQTDAARQWEGWGTALKPAHEPIVVARKPLIGTVAENVQCHGTGAINIDASRISTTDKLGGGDQLARTKVKADGWNRPWMQDEAAKASHADRVNRNVEKAEGLGRWPANVIHDGSEYVVALFGEAARFYYCAKASKSDRGEGNNHPTVKPTDLMRYLVRLVTPPGGVVLDPFMGSGSTGKASVLEGFDFIGIERDPDFAKLAESRIAAAVNTAPLFAEGAK